MKLILTHEVTGLGAPGDVVEVKDGYGRNFLVPRGLGMRWTKGGEKQITTIRKARDLHVIHDQDDALQVKARLENLAVKVSARAGAGGRLFGAVSVTEIVEAIKAAGGPLVDKRRIEVGQPIKSIGQHSVTLRVHPEVSATVAIEVVEAA